MALAISDTSQYEANVIPVPGKIDGVTIVWSATAPRGSTVVDRAVHLSTDDTYELVADAAGIDGVLQSVEVDGKCTVLKGSGLKAPAGTGATLTPGSKLVGAQRTAARGYVRSVAAATLAEVAVARGRIVNNDNVDAVVFDLE